MDNNAFTLPVKLITFAFGLLSLVACMNQTSPASGLRKILDVQPEEIIAALSADARTALCFADAQTATPGIWRVDVSSRQKTQLIAGAKGRRFSAVRWSPDEKRISYVSTESTISAPFLPDARIMLADSNGANSRVIYGDGKEEKDRWIHDYDWSPNSQMIAVAVDTDLVIINTINRSRKKVAGNVGVPYGGSVVVSWSPDGSYIAYPGAADISGNTIWILNTVSGKSTRAFSEVFASNVELSPVWSPDSKRILMTSVVVASGQGKGTAEIVNLDTGAMTQVMVGATNVSGDWLPAFSLDGRRIALVVYDAKGNYHLIAADSAGKNVVDLGTVSSEESGRIQWAKDGKSILVIGTKTILSVDIS